MMKCTIYAPVRKNDYSGEFIDISNYSILESLALENAKKAEQELPQYYNDNPMVRIGKFEVVESDHVHKIVTSEKMNAIEKVVERLNEEREIHEKMPLDKDDTYKIGFIKGIAESLDILQIDLNSHKKKEVAEI